MVVQDQSTPAAAGTDSPSALSPLAAHLKQTCLGWPAYGIAFAIALDSALSHLDRGAMITRISPTAYRVQALPHAAGYRVTLGRCACDAPGPWCWHRAALHYHIAARGADHAK